MQASRWIAVWMAVGALGITGTGAGCGGDESGNEPPASSASTTSTGEGSAGSSGTGGHGGSGMGGHGGSGAGGHGGSGTGGHGGSGTGGDGGSGTGGDGGSGTGGDGGSMGQSFNLTLRGAGYAPAYDVGTDVYVEVIAVGETVATLSASDTIDDEGAFSVMGQVPGGKAYKMHWYVDLVADGECKEAEDHVWTQDIPTVTADITRSVAPNTDFGTCP
ncbi:hypothetical protein AB3662_43230 [Sorangium cellulosum]|uniref:hypothetical protein n=1 Tax=Sorangium cellulosum TaxID=56 RepID=UPI003D9A271A